MDISNLSSPIRHHSVHHVSEYSKLISTPRFSVYRFWALTAPIHFPYRLFHPRYILATTTQVHEAFFTPETPVPVVKRLEALLAPYETMLWPLQCLFRFVSGPDVLKSIVGWQKSGNEPKDRVSRIFVLAAEHDVLCTPEVSRDAALRYRVASRQLRSGGGQGLKPTCSPSSYPLMLTSGEDIHDENVSLDVGKVGKEGSKSDRDGVRFSVVSGLGHHLQNHVEWEKGAGEIEDWVKGL